VRPWGSDVLAWVASSASLSVVSPGCVAMAKKTMIADPKPRKRTKKIPLWKRKPENYCTEVRCHRPRRALMRCATHAVRELDSLWARLVRAKSRCEAVGWFFKSDKWNGRLTTQCGGNLQAAHGFSRRYGATRWNLLNGFALCAGHHRWFTSSPLEWEVFMRERLGELIYEEMRRLALSGGRPDYEQAYATLVEAA
jgi:hypothetical protein